MSDMHTLHDQANDAFARRLLDALPAMRSKFGDLSQAIETPSGRPLARLDAHGIAEEGRDFAGGEGLGVTA